MADIRLALRSLRKAPLLTTVVILSLGLGIGANTAMFSLLHQVVLRSLPVPEPDRLVFLTSPKDFKGGRSSSNNSGDIEHIFSYKAFRGLEKHRGGVAGIAGFRLFGANIAYRAQTVDGGVLVVSGQYFPLLGVNPLIGRMLGPEDDVDGSGRPVAVLSHAYWQNRLGADPGVLNQPVRVNGQVLTVVGVAPKGFTGTTFGDQPDVFVPLALKPALTPNWNGTDKWNDYWLYLFARLDSGVSLAQAADALNSTYRGITEEQAKASPDGLHDVNKFRASKITLIPGAQGNSRARENTATGIKILMASTLLVLLIAIANTANLLLARAAQRSRELAIRTAIGAGRGAIMRQLLTESMLLSVGGGLAGLLFAAWTLQALLFSMSDGRVNESLTAELSWPVLLFAVSVSLLAGLICGLYPAWDASRRSVSDLLREQSTAASPSLGAARVRKLLVGAQVTLATVLLIPTGLFLKSLANIMNQDLGLETENVITFRVSPELNAYKPEQSRALFERMETELAGIPGVRAVTASLVPLLDGDQWGNNLTVEGYSRDPRAETHSMFNQIGGGYFSQLGVPLIAGREFTERDTLAGAKVAVVNERFAKHFFGAANPIGRKFALGAGDVTLDTEIVGVIKDIHYSDVKQKPPRVYYTPWRQSKEIGSMSFYVRTALAPEQVFPQVRRVMSAIDPHLPLENLRTLEEQIRVNIRGDRIVLQLSAAFAAVATLLAMLGIYGVMAYSVTRRTREIGIRIALGAATLRIRAMVLRELGLILLGGLAIGIPAAAALARYAESQLFGVKSSDPGVMAGAALALIAAALLATYVPARRAARIQPMQALREE